MTVPQMLVYDLASGVLRVMVRRGCAGVMNDAGRAFLARVATDGRLTLDCIHDKPSTARLASHRYALVIEHVVVRNGVSSMFWEALLCETLCFYSGGAPNVSEWLDPRAFIHIDIANAPAEAIDIIHAAMTSGQWECRLPYIRAAKQRVLNWHAMCPTLERVLLSTRCVAPIVCFVHSCHFESVGLAVLADVLAGLERVRFDEVFVYNVGARISASALEQLALRAPRTCKSMTLIETGLAPDVFELPTLAAMHAYACTMPLARMLYVHTKGVSRGADNACVSDWRAYMLHMLTVRAAECVDMLSSRVDVVGCNYLGVPYPHFSGNFWWTIGTHVRMLRLSALTDKASAEWWIFSTRPRAFHCLWQSGLQSHYTQRYLAYQYE